jgi:hypothetical protein
MGLKSKAASNAAGRIFEPRWAMEVPIILRISYLPVQALFWLTRV